MEAVYLLCSIASTIFKSAALSLLLALRSIPHLLFSNALASAASASSTSSAAAILYEGRVRHVRRRPVAHSFEYPVRYALFDLDGATQPSHVSAHRARQIAATNGPVLLLTIPASVGYEQNPLSVYYCYDVVKEEEDEERRELRMCIAEVTNTPWGERVMFGFRPGSDLVAKPLHVSPFMDMVGNWSIRADAPGEDLYLAISVQHPTLGNYFTATLSAKRVHSSSSSLSLAAYFWLMPHRVAVWIYLQALSLWWKNVAFLGHPKYMNPKYRDDALLRDRDLCCSRNIKRTGNHPNPPGDGGNKNRWFVWRDAQWPWS